MTISIKPTASGSTIEQDGSAILSIDASGNLTVPNNLSVTGTAPIPDALSTASGSAPSYSARAWVNFNGTGTVAIRASGNVSSITDNGTGNYDVNFTTAMADTNYATVSTCAGLTGMATNRDIWLQAESEATDHATINSYYRTSQVDIAHCYVAIFR
jgi:hypothetical protein